MSESLAGVLVLALAIYAGIGLLFALPFVFAGAQRIDPAARGGSIGFRLVVLPGVVALWPLVLRRLIAGGGPPEEKSAHRATAAGGDG